MQQVEAIVRNWAGSLLNASVQIAVLVALVALACFMLRKSSPVVRYALWCIVLVRLCVPVGLTIPTGIAPRALSAATERPQISPRTSEFTAQQRSEPRSQRWKESRERRNRERQIMATGGMLWLGGSGFIVLVIGLRAFCLRRRVLRMAVVHQPQFLALVQKCATDLGLKKTVEVRMAPDAICPSPAVTALFQPVIILPQTMVETWSLEELEPILIHELAHVRRRDVAINWLQIGLQTLYFFHPLVWLANWQIRSLREEACDDLSIAKMGGKRHAYSASLLRAIELANTARPTWGVVALAERKSDLVKRLRRLLRPEYQAKPEAGIWITTKVLAMGSMCLLLSGMVPVKPQYHGGGRCTAHAKSCRSKPTVQPTNAPTTEFNACRVQQGG